MRQATHHTKSNTEIQSNLAVEYRQMSAYGTKKPGGDRAVQLTFPANFQKAFDAGIAYFPSTMGEPLDVMVGTHFQSVYHEQKRQEANQSVMNGLQARRSMEQKLLTGPHNYHLPKPVLSQRRFANPMNGVVGFASARRDDPNAPFSVVENTGGLRGGVVATAAGQEFYALQLQRRIDQLNKMNAVAQGFAVPMGQKVESYDNRDFGGKDKTNFFLYLRTLTDSVISGDLSRFTFENLKEMMDMLFKFAPVATEEDFQDINEAFDDLLPQIRQLESGDEATAPTNAEYAETLKIYMEKANTYVDEMGANVDRNPKDKMTLSRSLIKSLGFHKFQRKARDVEVVADEARRNPRVRDAFENFDGRHGGDDDDDDGGGDGRFNRPARTREDDDADGMPRQPFAGRGGDPNRDRYGKKNGLIVFGGPTYFGEESDVAEQVAEVPMVAPLGLSGFEPEAQMPQPSMDVLKTAVEEELESKLTDAGWSKGMKVETFINDNFETAEEFVGLMERSLLSKGFTKAQIAKGMDVLGYPFFAEYIASNAGDLAPTPIVPARRFQPPPPPPLALPPQAGATLESLGLPTSRADLLRANSIAEIREIGSRIPREFGGPYRPREGTKRRSAMSRLVTLLKNIEPNF